MTQIIRASEPSEKVYLTGNDLFARQYWVGALVALDYQLDALRFKAALTALADATPVIAGRVRQDEQGRFFVDDSNSGFPFSSKERPSTSVKHALSCFISAKSQAHGPVTGGGEEFMEQLDYLGMMSGQAPICALQLTNVQDGCIIGASVSHAISDAEGLGQLLHDLGKAYQGQTLAPKLASRLGLQQLAPLPVEAAGEHGPAQTPTDEKLIASLPSYRQAPQSWESFDEEDFYVCIGCPHAERQAGFVQEFNKFHIPGAGIARLQRDLLASSIVKSAGITSLSVHDVVGALIWILREVGEGNDLSEGLKQAFTYTVDLRRCNGADLGVPRGFWGNAFGGQLLMPSPPPASPEDAGPHLGDPAYLRALLATAAKAIHEGTQEVRREPESFLKKAAGFVNSLAPQDIWLKAMAEPGPLRDNAVIIGGWRNTSMDRADFGQGPPSFITGCSFPRNYRMSFLTIGPCRDGVLVTLAYKCHGRQRLLDSKILDVLAPELTFIQPAQT